MEWPFLSAIFVVIPSMTMFPITRLCLQPEVLGGQLAVCDLAGRELMVRPVEDTAMEVDLATLPSGTYLVKLTTSRGVTTRRLLVE